jgi:uncharacterized membrane protein
MIASAMTNDISSYSVRILLGAIVLIALVLVFASYLHHRYHFTKKAFFTIIATISVGTMTALLVSHALLISSTQNATVERRSARMVINVCDQQVPISSDQPLLASVGNGRQRVTENGRLEYLGYTIDPIEDVSIGSFFTAMGAGINANMMTIPYPREVEQSLADSVTLAQFIRSNPLGEQYLELQSGNSCTVYPSMISVYVYRYDEATSMFTQQRLVQPETYVISDQPEDRTDCIVVTFGNPSERTDLRCGDYPALGTIKFETSNGAGS